MRQKQKNLLSLAILAAVACAIVGYAWYGVKEPGEREEAERAANERLFATSGDADSDSGGKSAALTLKQITIDARGGKTTLEKRKDTWWIVSPVEARADAMVMDTLASQLQSAKFKKVIEAKPTAEDLARYGLTKPSFTVTATAFVPTPDGGGKDDPSRQRKVSLKAGIENTFDGSIYMQRNEDPTVWSAEGGIRWNFDKSLFDLRDKQVLGVDATKVQRLELKNARADFALERQSDKKTWRFLRPNTEGADAVAIASMLDSLKSSRALAFLEDSPEKRTELGLDAPEFDVRIAAEGLDPIRIRITRKTVEGEQKLYALREEGPHATLAEVTDAAVSGLNKTPVELRDRAVLSFAQDAAAQLTFTPAGGGERIQLERTQAADADAGLSEAWAVTAPKKGEARKWKVSSVLWTLGALKAEELGEVAPKDWEKYGVTKASRTVVVGDSAGRTLAELRIGNEVPERPGMTWVRGSRNQVLLVDSSRLESLPTSLAEFMDIPGGTDAGSAAASPP